MNLNTFGIHKIPHKGFSVSYMAKCRQFTANVVSPNMGNKPSYMKISHDMIMCRLLSLMIFSYEAYIRVHLTYQW